MIGSLKSSSRNRNADTRRGVRGTEKRGGSSLNMARTFSISPSEPTSIPHPNRLVKEWQVWRNQFDDFVVPTRLSSEPKDGNDSTLRDDSRHIIQLFSSDEDEDQYDPLILLEKRNMVLVTPLKYSNVFSSSGDSDEIMKPLMILSSL